MSTAAASASRPLYEPPADARTHRVARAFRGVMEALDLDLGDPNLADTPLRVARAYGELFSGLAPGAEPDLRTFPNQERYSQVVAVTGIPFHSVCAHHFLPFFGTAHVAYLPGERIVGLSKLARVVELYARRPQIQERLTEQVIGLLEERLRPQGAMVVLQARHFCMEMRGVAKPGAVTTTSAIRGAFDDARTRQEFLSLVSAAAKA
ncbi:MAG TPA: GTP cyclohydrolase I FolE [Vicinamibacteria bacterium]|nr:GTP cyclohydrolase I FolE [Vicinamibacteria bacterium]